MNLEGITINILTSQLQEKLLGGKIYKDFMSSCSITTLGQHREPKNALLDLVCFTWRKTRHAGIYSGTNWHAGYRIAEFF